MTIEQSIKDAMLTKMEDGTVEKLLAEHLEKGVKSALDNLFRSYGDVTKVIEGQIKSVMVPYLETYDYSEYIVKLDSVLTDVLKSSAAENENLLKNFKTLMTDGEYKERTINASDLFEKWKKYVSENVETNDLEVITDDGVSYETVEVRFDTDYSEERSWSSFEYANLVFECDHDEEMNFLIRLRRWKTDKNKSWDIEYDKVSDIKSLRYINDFELLLMRLVQSNVKIILDEESGSDDVQPEAEPEASFS